MKTLQNQIFFLIINICDHFNIPRNASLIDVYNCNEENKCELSDSITLRTLVHQAKEEIKELNTTNKCEVNCLKDLIPNWSN